MRLGIPEHGRARAVMLAVGFLGVPAAGLFSAAAPYPCRAWRTGLGWAGLLAIDLVYHGGMWLAAASAAVASLSLPVRQWLRLASAVCFAIFGAACYVGVYWEVTTWLDVIRSVFFA